MNPNARSVLLGRAITVLYPEITEEVLTKITPLSDDLSLMPRIVEAIDKNNPELIIAEKCILFVAVAHKIYYPACLFDQRISKLPTGIRDEMARCLGFVNSEMCNHYRSFVYPHLKNPRYLAKIQVIINHVLPN